jgi:hypothetical protein
MDIVPNVTDTNTPLVRVIDITNEIACYNIHLDILYTVMFLKVIVIDNDMQICW